MDTIYAPLARQLSSIYATLVCPLSSIYDIQVRVDYLPTKLDRSDLGKKNITHEQVIEFDSDRLLSTHTALLSNLMSWLAVMVINWSSCSGSS